MGSVRRKPKRIISVARWLGVVWSAFWTLSMGLVAYGEIVIEGNHYEFDEGTIITLFVLLGLVGVIIGWKNVITGGVMLVIVGLAFSVFGYITAGTNKIFVPLISGVPFLISGVLFLAGGEYESG